MMMSDYAEPELLRHFADAQMFSVGTRRVSVTTGRRAVPSLLGI